MGPCKNYSGLVKLKPFLGSVSQVAPDGAVGPTRLTRSLVHVGIRRVLLPNTSLRSLSFKRPPLKIFASALPLLLYYFLWSEFIVFLSKFILLLLFFWQSYSFFCLEMVLVGFWSQCRDKVIHMTYLMLSYNFFLWWVLYFIYIFLKVNIIYF